jgi:hypothetical protein
LGQGVSNLVIAENNKKINFSFFFNPKEYKYNTKYGVLIEYSMNGGKSFNDIAKTLSGSNGNIAFGAPEIKSGKKNVIVWDVLKDKLQSFSGDEIVFRLKVFESNIVFGDKPTIGTLLLPSAWRSNKSMKLTNLFYALAVTTGAAYVSRNYWYNKYLNATGQDDISTIYNYANYSNQALIVGIGLGGFVFSYNLGRLTNNRIKYSSLRAKF